MGPRVFITVQGFLWCGCSPVHGSSARWLCGGLMATSSKRTDATSPPPRSAAARVPVPMAPLPACASTGDTQRQVGLSLLWALQASLVGMRFDSKCDFAHPTILLGSLLWPWMWGIFFWWDPTFSCLWLFRPPSGCRQTGLGPSEWLTGCWQNWDSTPSGQPVCPGQDAMTVASELVWKAGLWPAQSHWIRAASSRSQVLARHWTLRSAGRPSPLTTPPGTVCGQNQLAKLTQQECRPAPRSLDSVGLSGRGGKEEPASNTFPPMGTACRSKGHTWRTAALWHCPPIWPLVPRLRVRHSATSSFPAVRPAGDASGN